MCDHPPADVAALLRGGKQLGDWAAGGEVAVLGLFRQPAVGKLHDAFQGAGRKLHEAAVFGFYAEAAFDTAKKAYATSPLEEQLKTKAPAVLVSKDKGASWAKCKVPHTRTSKTVGDCIAAIEACALPEEPQDEL